MKNLFKNSIYAFAFGDAYGENPHFPYIWTDDTSLTLSLIDAFSKSKGIYLFKKNLYKNIKDYFEKGKFSPYKIPFKYGKTTYKSIKRKKGLKSEFSCGNGSAMRALPLAFLLFKKSLLKRSRYNHVQSAITHAHLRVLVGCDIYVEFAQSLIKYKDKNIALKDLRKKMDILTNFYGKNYFSYFKEYEDIFKPDFYKKAPPKSSAFIVDTIKCIFYSVFNAKDIFTCLKISSKFKGDPDTICAMSMGLYGILEVFPKVYFKKLKSYHLIEKTLNLIRL